MNAAPRPINLTLANGVPRAFRFGASVHVSTCECDVTASNPPAQG